MKTITLALVLCLLFAASIQRKHRHGRRVLVGGAGGIPFDDRGATGTIRSIRLRAGNGIDAIQVNYGGTWGPIRGNPSGGQPYSFDLAADEHIVTVRGRSGQFIDQLIFFTNKGRVFGPYGGAGGTPFSESAPTGQKLGAIYGRSGSAIDSLFFAWNPIVGTSGAIPEACKQYLPGGVKTLSRSVLFKRRRGRRVLYGGDGGIPFSDLSFTKAGDITGIRLDVTNNVINMIQIRYGSALATPHGVETPQGVKIINLVPGENIIGVAGEAGTKINRLLFTTDIGYVF
jgi:hypothetical protein